MHPVRRIVNLIRSWWRSSLLIRVMVTTVSASIIVLLIGGYLVIDQARAGIIDAKKRSAAAESWVAVQRMQNQLNDTDIQHESLVERLGQLADEAGNQPNQYAVVIETLATSYLSGGVESRSVPADLRERLNHEESGMWTAPTSIFYNDGHHEAGIAIGTHLASPTGQLYPVYFLFPATSELTTLQVLKRALWTTGALLVIAMGVISWLITRQVAIPVRHAQLSATKIAEGNLDTRLEVRGDDEFAGLSRAMNDMASTLQDQIVQLEDLSRVQRQFVSDVSHELRTPLTTIRMAADMLYESREEFSEDQQRTSELLHGEIERFDAMLADLLEISRFDAGAATISYEQVDLVQLVSYEIDGCRMVADEVDSEIRLHAHGPILVEIDPARIRRIMRNLISNAIAHADRKPIDISIAADEHVVSLVVRDYGLGFAEENAEKVFLRFWREDASRNRILGGTGLGLAISLEDAHLHRGHLQAWGKVGCGASFRLTIPRSADDQADHHLLDLVARSSPLEEGR